MPESQAAYHREAQALIAHVSPISNGAIALEHSKCHCAGGLPSTRIAKALCNVYNDALHSSGLQLLDHGDKHEGNKTPWATVGFSVKLSIPLKPAQHRELSQLLRRLVNRGISLILPAYHSLIGSKVDHDVVLGQGAPKRSLRTMYASYELALCINRVAKRPTFKEVTELHAQRVTAAHMST